MDPQMMMPMPPTPGPMPGMGSMGAPEGPTCPMCGQPVPAPMNMAPNAQTMQPLPGRVPNDGDGDEALLAALMGQGGGMPPGMPMR